MSLYQQENDGASWGAALRSAAQHWHDVAAFAYYALVLCEKAVKEVSSALTMWS